MAGLTEIGAMESFERIRHRRQRSRSRSYEPDYLGHCSVGLPSLETVPDVQLGCYQVGVANHEQAPHQRRTSPRYPSSDQAPTIAALC